MKTWFLVIATALTGATVLTTSRAADAPASAPATAPSDGGPNKFYRTISAIDTTANTFTVDGQVYSIVAESQVTKAEDGSKAALADATVGESARGSFVKDSDGKLHITKVRFGKKTGGKAGGGKSAGKNKSTTQPSAQ